ncbi:putative neutral zinc metallopeptidase [Aedoeadaptatus nemausensis]|uniref:Putative neutral zinc metallopeptidase n=1 Tax=Aedoeadaptatus nemausensis TaxID=2582829 RepID=A0A6V6XZL8_9FIRM|nr:zinc metallopeptidase [Peptoniphilus nemausensis]CAC9924895.1 putative neutral zinc metallopeptidase [Peptoniphilus nemausensis]
MYGYYGYDIQYLMYLLPGMLLAMYAQAKIKTNFETYSKISNSKGLTGEMTARQILSSYHIDNVRVERVKGSLTDHYDPTQNVLRLSDSVHDSTSIAAVGVAAHEAGHAIQHNIGYAPLKFRNAIVPAANIGSNLSFLFVFIGLMAFRPLLKIGIALFAITVLFQLLTLPVEYDASRRAKVILRDGILSGQEMEGVEKVLSAAALTYVASLVTAIGTLLRFLSLDRRRD